MDRLFAPWREAYVTKGAQEPGCVLCRAQEPGGDSLVVHTSALNFLVMNLYPYSSGHVMIATRRHVATLGEATAEELAEMMALARRLEAVFHEVYKPEGINVGMNLGQAAGAGVADHIHLHMVPRWVGDANFMTVIGGTRVIPEDPVKARDRLRVHFA
jgi:ATP adenylyltransferase